MNLSKVFGDVLRELRKDANISQEELADMANLDRSYISILERGLKQPSLQTIFILSNSLKITPSKFIEKVENAYK
jgi:transcriptional regulator with XRE-family HTH domain